MPFLDMNWGNCDIDVVEQASIPKFSHPDNIGTPLRHFESFFDDTLVDMIVGHIQLYSHRDKEDTSFEITNEIFRLFLAMLMLKRCHKLPECKMYWETTPDTFVQAMPDAIPRDIFERILRNLHLCENELESQRLEG